MRTRAKTSAAQRLAIKQAIDSGCTATIEKERKGEWISRERSPARTRQGASASTLGSRQLNEKGAKIIGLDVGIVTVRSDDGSEADYYIDRFDGSRRLDISKLRLLPNMRGPLLEAIRRHFKKIKARTQRTLFHNLAYGFISYFSEEYPLITLDDLDEEKVRKFGDWIGKQKLVSGEGNVDAATKKNRYNIPRVLISALATDSVWQKQATQVLGNFLHRTFGTRESVRGENVLTYDQLRAIHQAALREIENTRQRQIEGQKILQAGLEAISRGSTDFTDFSVAFAAMVNLYPETFPSGSAVLGENQALWKAIYTTSKARPGRHSVDRMARYRYLAPDDLISFVVLFAIEGAFNSETVLNLRTADVKRHELLGRETVRVTGRKPRSSSGIYTKDLDADVVMPILQILQEMTQRLRSTVRDSFKDHLFVYGTTRGRQTSPQGFTINKSTFAKTFRKFIKRNSLPAFTLLTVRKSLLDAVGQNHGSLVVQYAANHSSFAVTDGHYLGPGTIERDRERLGETIQQYERFIATKAKVDVRRSSRQASADQGAATPGFICSDPYDSPLPGQRKNSLCRAYGQCPACPLSVAPDGDVVAIAQWHSLLEAVDDARQTLDPANWLNSWAPVASALILLLDAVDESLKERASLLKVRLPAVG